MAQVNPGHTPQGAHYDADRYRGSSLACQSLHPYGGSIKSILNAVVVIAVVLWR
jgi:hypothetical protein